jgi:hypothetical protein
VKNKNIVHIIWKTHGGSEEETPEQQQYTQQIRQTKLVPIVASTFDWDGWTNVNRSFNKWWNFRGKGLVGTIQIP